jgi:4-hydroxybenzoate polyprenyltransferase
MINLAMNKYISKDFLKLMRFDHWVKNILILPGFLFAVLILDLPITIKNILDLFFVAIVTSIASSGNYLINEYLDRKTDAFHPTKNKRVFLQKDIDVKAIIIIYLSIFIFCVGASYFISTTFFALTLTFFIFAQLYNVPPIRLKDRAILDIYLESLNSPIRFTIGWVSMDPSTFPPISLIFTLFTGGAFLMTAKRISELKVFESKFDQISITRYRKSFKFYSQSKLFFILQLNYGFTILLLSIFSLKYNLEYLFFLPFMIIMFSMYTMDTVKNEMYVMEKPHYLFSNFFFLVVIFISLMFYYLLRNSDIYIFQYLLEFRILSIQELIANIVGLIS